ncbi:MAG: CPBP family intramembrane metalloprotease [Leptolyngbya sp. SIO4C5]|nr:CPBP family intramembrane metalloprotease [Leptolyngbya sp. SIO4C5]
MLSSCSSAEPPRQVRSRYGVALQSDFNRPEYLPAVQPAQPAGYQPVADWVGRLILPTAAERQARDTDWVWLEIYQAPAASRVTTGQKLRLTWQDTPALQTYVQQITRQVAFTAEAIAHQQAGNVHPTRLDGWQQVGPLQSLAGARPLNDVIVALSQVQTVGEELRIGVPPVQVAERFYGLVQILAPELAAESSVSADCPGSTDCNSNLFRVQHYNPDTQQFDGLEETVRIPQVLPAADGLYQSTVQALAQSPAGAAGWYLYGAQNAAGRFVVKAIAPRSLFQLQPDTVLTNPEAALNYINFGNWRHTPARKGTLQSVRLVPFSEQTETSWQVGDRALVVHLFGGIGGEQGETPPIVGTVTGHFAYGTAEVVRDAFTGEPRFEIVYQQVYSHNPNGIVSGDIHWSEYMGNLQRGWLGTRPVSDAIVRFAPLLQDYQFGQVRLSPFEILQRQLQIMMARYRVGDGTGAAIVTPAQSCIQDSSQAVYQTIQLVKQQVGANPAIAAWLAEHPGHEQTQRFEQLVALGRQIEKTLIPLGIVRPDWQQTTQALAGIGSQSPTTTRNTLITQLLSWRTLIPRLAYDQVITLFWQRQAGLWFLRTNQVGGSDSTIEPLAPTVLFGRYVAVPTLFSRLIESLRWPSMPDWLVTLGLLGLYGAIAVPLGLRLGLLSNQAEDQPSLSGYDQFKLCLAFLVLPALVEELIFRVLLLPHPTEGVWPITFLLWSLLSLALFVIYHPLNALTGFRAGRSLFFNPVFLWLAGLLGLVCTLTYAYTGSLWTITLLHWVVVVVWQLRLGGYERLHSAKS